MCLEEQVSLVDRISIVVSFVIVKDDGSMASLKEVQKFVQEVGALVV